MATFMTSRLTQILCLLLVAVCIALFPTSRVQAQDVNPSLTAEPPVVLLGEPVTFIVTADTLFDGIDFVIDFGDGNTGRSPTPEIVHVYEAPGAFAAFVQLELDGMIFAEAPPVEVVVNEPVPPDSLPPSLGVGPEGTLPDDSLEAGPDDAPPAVIVTADPNTVTAGGSVTFTVAVDPPVEAVEYVFTFSDRPAPETSPDPAFSRSYEQAGVFEASVQLVQEGVVFAESPLVMVAVTPEESAGPLPTITLRAEPPEAHPDDPVVFSAAGGPDDPGVEYRFHFGDGETSDWSAAREVSHTYAEAGSYNATVEVRGLPNTTQPVPSSPILMTVAALPAAAATQQPGSSSLLWIVIIGAVLLLAIVGLVLARGKKVGPQKAVPQKAVPPKAEPEQTMPGSEVVVKPQVDPGTPQVATDQPLRFEMEMRLRPIKDRGQHHLEAGADLIIQEKRDHGS